MTVQESLDDFISVLNSFAEKASINKFKANETVDNILESTEQERQCWTEEELLAKSFTLYNYGAYLQRCLNQQNIKKTWAESNLRVIFGKEANKYEAWSYNQRQDMIIADNQAALTLHQIIMNADTRIQQLSHISGFISKMGNSLDEMAKSKRASRYEGR